MVILTLPMSEGRRPQKIIIMNNIKCILLLISCNVYFSCSEMSMPLPGDLEMQDTMQVCYDTINYSFSATGSFNDSLLFYYYLHADTTRHIYYCDRTDSCFLEKSFEIPDTVLFDDKCIGIEGEVLDLSYKLVIRRDTKTTYDYHSINNQVSTSDQLPIRIDVETCN